MKMTTNILMVIGVILFAGFTVAYATFGQVLPGPPPLAGDANLDGVVSAGDYASVQATFGDTIAPGPDDFPLMGDANHDGVVSAGDYAAVQANFGNTAAPGDWYLLGDANFDGVVSAGDYAAVPNDWPPVLVPEPATVSLLVLGGTALIRHKRK